MTNYRLPAIRAHFDDNGTLWISMPDVLECLGTMKEHAKEIFDTDYLSGFDAVENMLADLNKKAEINHAQ